MRVLLVEKAPGVAGDLPDLLGAGEGQDVERPPRLSIAMQRLLVDTFDCAVVALGPAGDPDLDLLDRLLAAALDTPLVVVIEREDEDLALRAVRAGAQEVLVRTELTAATLKRHLAHAAERHGIRSRLARQALHDPLTGLPNRLLFLDRLRQALSRLERTQTCLAVLFVDLDAFKAVNDRHGHEAGDAALTGVAAALTDTLRGGDTAARMGGDEFAVLCEDVAGEPEASQIAERLLQRVRLPVSIGIALASTGAEDPKALVRAADTAMYAVKRAGGAGHAAAGAALGPPAPALAAPARRTA